MRRHLSLALLILAALPLRAWADSLHEIAHAGLWSTTTGLGDDGVALCAVTTTGADGRRIAVEQRQGQAGVTLRLSKPSWSIPPGTPIALHVIFDHTGSTPQSGLGAGTDVRVDLPFDQSVPFMRALRYGLVIQVGFNTGNEPIWTGGLAGSARAIDAFDSCRTSLTPAQPTQPFTQSPSPPTQPYPAIPPAAPINPANLPPIPQHS